MFRLSLDFPFPFNENFSDGFNFSLQFLTHLKLKASSNENHIKGDHHEVRYLLVIPVDL